ncbi:hypothetical protein Tco_0786803 [Tanacetum coccineum]
MFLTTRSIRSTIPHASTVAATPLPPLHHLPTGATTAAPPPPFGCYPATATPPSSSSCHHHLRPPSSSPPSSQPPHHKGAAGLCLNSQKGAPGLGIAPQKGAFDFGSHPRGSANRATTSMLTVRMDSLGEHPEFFAVALPPISVVVQSTVIPFCALTDCLVFPIACNCHWCHLIPKLALTNVTYYTFGRGIYVLSWRFERSSQDGPSVPQQLELVQWLARRDHLVCSFSVRHHLVLCQCNVENVISIVNIFLVQALVDDLSNSAMI